MLDQLNQLQSQLLATFFRTRLFGQKTNFCSHTATHSWVCERKDHACLQLRLLIAWINPLRVEVIWLETAQITKILRTCVTNI